jgi:hyperosmotically inducible periplasmic protein
MPRTLGRLAIVSLVLLTAVGCTTMTGQTLGTNIDNKTTTAEVKAKLTADRLQNLTWVDVDTNDGTVYLTGTATTDAQKLRATEIAQQVTGVKKVVNNIQVRPAEQAGATTHGSSSQQARSDETMPAASPGDFSGQHTITGQVTSVDHANGHLALKTDHGDLMLHFPPQALNNVKQGDRIAVDLALRPAR